MNDRIKMMILGAALEQKPLYLRAKDMNYYTIAIDADPKAECFSFADKYYIVRPDAKKKLLDIAQEEKVNAVTSMITEWAHESIDYVSRRLGLPSFSKPSMQATIDKLKMRQFLKRAKLNQLLNYQQVAKERDVYLFLKKVKKPVVLKPVDSSGQRGVSKIDLPSQIKAAYAYAIAHSRKKTFIVEEYFPGREFHCTAAVLNGKIAALSLSTRILSKSAFGVAVRHIYPADVDESVKEKIYDICTQLIDLFKQRNAIIYPQFMINNNDVVLIEYAERMPGGFLHRLFELTQGFDMVKFQLDMSLGRVKSSKDYILPTRHNCLTIKFLTAKNGYEGELLPGRIREVKNLEAVRSSKGIIDAGFFGKDRIVRPLRTGLDRFFYIIASGRTAQEAIDNSDIAAEKLEFIYE